MGAGVKPGPLCGCVIVQGALVQHTRESGTQMDIAEVPNNWEATELALDGRFLDLVGENKPLYD